MKFYFSFVLALFFALQVNAQVPIGFGNLVDESIPIEPYYEYTYSQIIYLSSEINASGNITGVKFFANPATTLTTSSDWTVYLGHTTKANFTSTTDWIPAAGLTQVFSGTATIAGGVVTITFTAPFAYNGTDNLVIAVDENLAGYDPDTHDFYCTGVSSDRAITYYNDNTNPDPATPPTATGLRQSIANVELLGILQACPTPTSLAVSGLTTTSTNLVWTENGTATQWQIEYGALGFVQGAGTLDIANTNPTYSLGGLTASTAYSFYVRAICGVGDTSFWAGPYNFFTGYCIPAPLSVDGSGITNVTMGTINNTTGAEVGNYGDYTTQITNVTQNMTLPISITLEAGYDYDLWVWVDWNDDLDFNDAGEEYFLGTSTNLNPTTFSGSILIPLTAPLGNHRIRIGGADAGLGTTAPSDPCYSDDYAAFEDYTLNVTTASLPELVINEIMYNPAEPGTDTAEFIEIYNNGTTAVDVTNFTLTGGAYTFPNTTIPAGGYYVVAVNSGQFNNVYGFVPDGQFVGGLNNATGESIVLKNASGVVIDSVFYRPVSPWPVGAAQGGGASIVLCDPNTDNNDGANWSAATTPVGVIINGFAVLASPGAANACPTADVTPSITGVNTTYCNVAFVSGSLVITNNDTNPVANVPYVVTVNGTPIASGTVPSIAASGTATVPIGPVPASTTGVGTIIAYTNLPSDIDVSNDTASMVVFISNTSASAAVDNMVSCNAGNDAAATASGADGIGAYTFLWDAAAANQATAMATGLMAGVYDVTVTDSTGCADVASITITEPAVINAAPIVPTDVSCNGAADGAIDITVSGGTAPYNYAWSNGATTEDLSGLSGGNYGATIVDDNGCSLILSPFPINEPSAITVTTVNNGNGTATAAAAGGVAPYSFVWSSGETTETIAAVGLQVVTVTDASGCDALDSIDIVVGVTELESASAAMTMYPNPTTGNIFVSFELATAADVQIQVVNVAGQVVLTQSLSNIQSNKVELATADLPSGMYVVHAILADERISKKLVINRP